MTRRLALLLSVLLCTATTGVAAEKSPVSFMPYVGGYIFDGEQNLDHSMVMGLRLGYAVEEAWGVEGLLERIPGNVKGSGDHVDLTRYGLDGYYNFPLNERLIPFAAAGFSGLNSPGEKDALFSWGGGVKYMVLDKAAALRLDLRHLVGLDSDHYSNFEYTFGLQIPYCGGKPLPVAPADSDKDGVIDSLDRCPTTPAGEKVDANGCPFPVAPADSDKDGVIDSQDQCPMTPAGEKVDANGCPLPVAPADSDKDGVVDGQDQCPSTPAGEKVDSKGCPLPVPPADSDKDGVVDSKDLCPNTKAGQKVDENGCPVSEEPYTVNLNINFETGTSAIAATYHDDLKRVGDYMKAYPSSSVTIEGHTDSQGKREANMKLSQDRADQVRKYLIEKLGVSGDRVTAKGYGSSRPIGDNGTAKGRQMNRRIEAIFKK